MRLVLGHLYGDLLNLYADRGNITTLRQRCAWRGIDLDVRQIGIGDPVRPDELDLLFMGGGQDGDQRLMADDLFRLKADALRGALRDGLPMLVVCGGYQLFGHYYQPAEGPRLPGLGLFDLHTVHPGTRVPRCIGNVVIEWSPPGRHRRRGGRGRQSPRGGPWWGSRTTAGAPSSGQARDPWGASSPGTATTPGMVRRGPWWSGPSGPTCTARCCPRTRTWPTTS